MSDILRMHSGRVIAAQDFAEAQKNEAEVKEATETAADIIARAEQRAAEIIANAEARVQQIAQTELERFVDEEAIDNVAAGVQVMLNAAETIRDEFDAYTPWMLEFVETSVMRITGVLPAEKLWAGLIEQGVSDLRDRFNLVLHCHPTKLTELREAVAGSKFLCKSVRDVFPDRSLGLDECLIQSGQGITDISLSTQLAAVLKALREMAQKREPEL